MGFWKDLFEVLEPDKPEKKPVAIIEPIRNPAIEFKQKYDARIAEQNQILSKLGLPIPKVHTEFEMVDTGGKLSHKGETFSRHIMTLPTYSIPEHLIFNFVHKEWHKKFYRIIEVYVITGNSALLDRAKRDFNDKGFSYLIRNYDGKFFNRPPYAAYKNKTDQHPKKIYTEYITQQEKEQEALPGTQLVPLEQVFYTPQQIDEILWRYELLKDACAEGDSDGWFPSHPKLFGETELFRDNVNTAWKTLSIPKQQAVGDMVYFKVIPNNETVKQGVYNQFFASLKINQPLTFELVATAEFVIYKVWCAKEDAPLFKRQIELHFPGFAVIEATDPPIGNLTSSCVFSPSARMKGGIAVSKDFSIDPYNQLFGVLEHMTDEALSFQVTITPFPEESFNIILDFIEKSSFSWRKKEIESRRPEWMTSIKAFSNSSHLLNSLNHRFISQYNTDTQNLQPEDINTESSLFLTNTELASLIHFSTSPLVSDRMETADMKAKLPPPLYMTGTTKIGISEAHGKRVEVHLPNEVRDRHTYIVGKSGTGKSTLMESIILQDIQNGFGCAVIDPHGDMVKNILDRIPLERVDDIVLFSPKVSPVSLDILSADSDNEIDLLSDDLVSMFERTSTSWGDKMTAILQMTFQTLLRVPGTSFTDISKLLTDKNYRASIVSKIDHPQLTAFWEQRYDMKQAEPILIRMDRLTTSGALQKILTQHKKSLNFFDVISDGKIFVADLSKGFLGEKTSHLIGSIIVSQIQLAVMRQGQLPMEQRMPFSLFVDEVQNFTTSSFSTILSEARKYKLRLTIAHQFVSQLPQDIQKAVFGNVGTMVFFGMSPDDLGAARHELGQYEPLDVANLPKYNAIVRPATAAKDAFSMVTLPLSEEVDPRIEVIAKIQTQQEYGITETTQPVKPEPVIEESVIEEPVIKTEVNFARPAKALSLNFPTNTEKIVHFLRQAEYLSQPQIIALTNLQASNASTALKKLVETGQIKSLDDRRPKIYSITKCNPTVHNILIRDLFVKICNSELAIRSVSFNKLLKGLNPDLTIEFIDENNQLFTVYFEIDRGTEGVGELVSKAARYASHGAQVGFIFEREPDMRIARTSIHYPFISFATLESFATLHDHAFYSDGDDGGGAPLNNNIPLPFFR